MSRSPSGALMPANLLASRVDLLRGASWTARLGGLGFRATLAALGAVVGANVEVSSRSRSKARVPLDVSLAADSVSRSGGRLSASRTVLVTALLRTL